MYQRERVRTIHARNAQLGGCERAPGRYVPDGEEGGEVEEHHDEQDDACKEREAEDVGPQPGGREGGETGCHGCDWWVLVGGGWK